MEWSGPSSSAGRRKSWNDRTSPMSGVGRSDESLERSSEIELEETHHNEHPKSPLIQDLTRPPSSRVVGSFKKWLSLRSTTIHVQKSDEGQPAEDNFVQAMEDSMEAIDLALGALVKYHLIDWLLIVLIWVLWLLSFLVHPFQRYVGAANFMTAGLRYPFKENTIPFQVVPVIALGIPSTVILGTFFKRRFQNRNQNLSKKERDAKFRKDVRDLHHGILGLVTTVALTALMTDVVKIGIGRPRPHFYARCFGSPTALPNYDPFTGNVICSTTDHQMKEAYKSFPSGHTSWTFAGLSYLAMYMAGKLSLFDRQGHSWKVFPIVLTMLAATFVGVTRIDDYWHHWTDVCTGASIGIVTAYFCYRQHFRSLFDDQSHMTYDYIPLLRPSPAPSRQTSEAEVSSYDVERGRL